MAKKTISHFSEGTLNRHENPMFKEFCEYCKMFMKQ